MSTKVVGKLDSWSDGDTGRSDFMRLEEGNNSVRCLTSPFQFYIHWANDATGQNRKVKCAVKDCPACQQGEKAQARWYVGVLNRRTGRPSILEVGTQIFNQIRELAKNEKWGDPRKYDINIRRNPKGTQPLYAVVPEPKEPLTSEEVVVAKAFVDTANESLSKMAETPTPDAVREKLGLSAPAKKAAPEPVVSAAADSDDDFDFES